MNNNNINTVIKELLKKNSKNIEEVLKSKELNKNKVENIIKDYQKRKISVEEVLSKYEKNNR